MNRTRPAPESTVISPRLPIRSVIATGAATQRPAVPRGAATLPQYRVLQPNRAPAQLSLFARPLVTR